MSDYTHCSLCSNPSSFTTSADSTLVPSNVHEFKEEHFTVWRCSGCQTLHSKENVELNKYYEQYPLKEHKLDFITRIGYGNRLRLLKKAGLKKEHHVVDYGCGAGLFVVYLKEKGYQYAVGYDPYVEAYSSEDTLKRQYDFVVAYDVIEHVEDPNKTFEALCGLLNESGKIAIGTPDGAKLDLKDQENYATELHQPYHRHILSEAILKQLGVSRGLKHIETAKRFYFDSPLPFINTKFIWKYIKESGNLLDVVVEPLNFRRVFRSPELIFYGIFGYFLPVDTCITMILAKEQ